MKIPILNTEEQTSATNKINLNHEQIKIYVKFCFLSVFPTCMLNIGEKVSIKKKNATDQVISEEVSQLKLPHNLVFTSLIPSLILPLIPSLIHT